MSHALSAAFGRPALLAGVALASLCASPALADVTAEDVRAAVISLAERQGLSLTIGDAAMSGSDVTLSDLTFSGDGTDQVIDQAVLTGVTEAGNGSYSAETLTISAFSVEADETMVDVGPVAFETVHIGGADEQEIVRANFHAERYSFGPLTVRTEDGEAFGFDGASLTYSPIDATPIETDFAVNGMRLDTSTLEEARARETMSALGYETVTANLTGEGVWDPESGRLAISSVTLAADDAADLTLDLEIGGYTADLARSLQELNTQMADSENSGAMGMAMMGLMQQLEVGGVTLSLKDQSLTGRILDFVAEQQGSTRDGVTAMAKAMVPMGLMQLQAPEFAASATQAIAAYLDDPDTLTISAKPDSPVPAASIMAMALGQARPAQYLELFNVQVTANE